MPAARAIAPVIQKTMPPALMAATRSAIPTTTSGRPNEIGTLTLSPGPKSGARGFGLFSREGWPSPRPSGSRVTRSALVHRSSAAGDHLGVDLGRPLGDVPPVE